MFDTVQNAKKTHPAGSGNSSIPHFEIKIAEIPQEKLSYTANPNVPLWYVCVLAEVLYLTALVSSQSLLARYIDISNSLLRGTHNNSNSNQHLITESILKVSGILPTAHLQICAYKLIKYIAFLLTRTANNFIFYNSPVTSYQDLSGLLTAVVNLANFKTLYSYTNPELKVIHPR